MKWTITQLQKFRNKNLLLDETIRVDELKEMDETIRYVSPIKVTGRVDIGSNKITFHLQLDGYFILPCSRTLLDVHYPIHVRSSETFFIFQSDQKLDDELDEDVNVVDGHTVDLRPIIRELLLLEIPMQVYSENENDDGAAPQSGRGWEVIQEKTKNDTIDPRLAELAKFFDKDDEPNS